MLLLRHFAFVVSFVLTGVCLCAHAGERAHIIVSQRGDGTFTSIQDALNSLPTGNTSPTIILIRNGLYNEKIFIRTSHVTLVGEDRDSTRIVYAELREEWNKSHNGSDWGSGTVNIDSGTTDITLANLTAYNNYGWQHGVFNKHQFAIRGAGTRIRLLHCTVMSDGGDALSLWDRQSGMYYHSDCHFEGWVDYVCPRGWCYITNSTFFGHNRPSASLWHDGSADKDQKFVIRDSYLDGVPEFPLGRNHLDGAIYLINCRFSRNLADRPFYRPPSSPREWQWGARHYFFNCDREGGENYAWYKDNLTEAENAPRADQVDAKWTFGGRWDPEATMEPVLPFAFLPTPRRDETGVSPRGATLKWIPGRNAEKQRIAIGKSMPPPVKQIQKEASFATGRLEPNMTYFWRVDTITDRDTIPGAVWRFTTGREPLGVGSKP